ncbi:MAG: hypothetical protein ACO3JG_00050 [Luteolibacter sp.]
MNLSDKHRGFALPAVLVVAGALLILAVGALLVVGIERNTARSFVDRERAELAARAGLEDVRGILNAETANDDFLVIQSSRQNPVIPGAEPAPHLFIARGKETTGPADDFNFRYIPLFSATERPDDAPFAAPEIDGLTGGAGEHLDFTTLPWLDKARAAWLRVRDGKGRVVARYAYWVEDLQGRVDPAIAGNDKGETGVHARAAWPFPAPGFNDQAEADDQPALDQIALFALDPAATDDAQGELGKTLLKNRKLLVSPDAQLAAAGIQPPLERLTAAAADGGFTGDLADPKARAVERGLASNLQPYLERPLIPHAAGIDPAAAGEPKLNLNRLLAGDRDSAVAEMAGLIKRALPDFEKRKGGFPDDYFKTLAANALDYADADNDATAGNGYRGIDGYPLVSEYLLKTRWETVRTENGRKFLVLSATVYVELWNMNHVPVSGQAQVSYETKYQFQIPPNPNMISLGDMTHADPKLIESDGYLWLPPLAVDLQPNEYRVYNCGTVTYTLDAVASDEWIASPLILSGESYAARGSGYRMRWNGEIADQSRGGIHRNDTSLFYPSDTKNQSRQKLRTTIPGHSHNGGSGFINNMGDPRMSYYLSAPQDANIYPQNYSPNRRNIREGTVYTSASRHNLVYGRVLPSEWPDGGHDSPFGGNNIYSLAGMTAGAFSDDHRINPDDPRFYNQLPDLSLGPEEAPTRLSNLGRFLSVTELGRTYDPVMWRVRTSTSNRPGYPWGDVLASSAASADHGGGNTLRIGRPEHPRFDEPGQRAAHLLDLFHAGRPRSENADERAGPLVEIAGHVNLNTATREALRMMIAGRLGQDPEMRRFINDSHDQAAGRRYPRVQKLSGSTLPDLTEVSGRIADAILRTRPYAGTGELANAREQNGTRVFGNERVFSGFTGSGYPLLQWTDSAAEETFARVFEAATVRSRNFRVWVIGQSVAPAATISATPEVLAEVRKVFTVFADPGERDSNGVPDPAKFRLRILHENDF